MLSPFMAGAFVTGAFIAVGHWFPWPTDLNRILAYAYGLASIIGGMFIIDLLQPGITMLDLIGVSFVAGVVTITGYLYDLAHERQQQMMRERLDRYVGPANRKD